MKRIIFLLIPVILLFAGCKEPDNKTEPLISVSIHEMKPNTGNAIQRQVAVISDNDWSVALDPGSADSWITVSPSSGGSGTTAVRISLSVNDSGEERSAEVIFSMPDDTSDKINVIQPALSDYSDGDYILLQGADVGNGINIIIMGDGYTEDQINAQRIYERDMRNAMEDIFSVYPYDAYREYFNVWMVVGISNQSGTSLGNTMKDTKFGSWITGEGSRITLKSDETVTEYAKSIPGLPQDENELTVLLMINTPEYAGTCIMYPGGYSIALCPLIEHSSPNRNARAVVMHECGGHGFGQLADEYVYEGTIPESERDEIRVWQQHFDTFLNIDFTADRNKVQWKDFFRYPQYTGGAVGFPLGVYEGALAYSHGVYRSEQTSCMDKNIDYFNAVSRYRIVRRIMALSGINPNLSLEEFVSLDNPRGPSYTPTILTEDEHYRFGKPILKGL